MLALASTMAVLPAFAVDSLEWNGFALVRPQTPAKFPPLDDDSLSAQIQIGVDWRPSVVFGAHVHALARNQQDGSHRGRAGLVEAYFEQNATKGSNRFHFMEGAFFLPTSRENVDSLWENPYLITSSALNSWLGEEFRPVGVDASWLHRTKRLGSFSIGGTVYRGNDTFGALPVDRGWALHDRWILLGEHVKVNSRFYTSVSAETDDRLGWAGRARWNNDHATLQYTRIDNRSDGRRYGELFNWATRFNIVGGDYTWHDWTGVAETGWGDTAIVRTRGRRTYGIRASYILLSRKISKFRVSVRGDQYEEAAKHDHALTAGAFWEPRGKLRMGIEAIAAGGQKRVAIEARYHF